MRKQLGRVYRKAKRIELALKERASMKRYVLFNIDTPKSLHQADREITVEGWVIVKDKSKFKIRINNNGKLYVAELGVERFDVDKAHGEVYGDLAMYAGFKSTFEFEDGTIIVEVSINNGKYKELKVIPVKFGVDKVPSYYHNPNISWRLAEHQNLLENNKQYYYEAERDQEYMPHKDDPRLMALYLPQFHPIEQNDKTWGKGFTEWTNVSAGQPRFVGHQQPILPSALGFYDLRYEDKILEQIELAKKSGIHGFAFYYYWFSGKKILDAPLNSFLKHKEWDFNFSICWANENWTKRWDGRDTDVIIAQEYKEDDPINFIKDVEHILNDPRYLQYDGKPVLSVYRLAHLKDPKKYAKIWREYFRKNYNKELYLVSVMSFDDRDPRDYGFDAAQDFAPLSAFFKHSLFKAKQYPYITVEDKLLDINFDGVAADYRTIATSKNLINAYDYKTFGGVTPSWDNDSRKKGKGFVFMNSNPDLYAEWLENTIQAYQEVEKSPIIYINAWNEWAEGAVLEPTQHQGYAVLNRTVEVLSKYSKNQENKTNFPSYALSNKSNKRLAVIIHLFHPDLWPAMVARLKNIVEPYDIFVSLNEKDKDVQLQSPDGDVSIFKYVLPNRGRDVLPFLFMLRRVEAAGYSYILKIHSKKSTHRTDGKDWLDSLLEGLLPSTSIVKSILTKLEEPATAVIGPDNHIVSLKRHMGSNKLTLRHLLERSVGLDEAENIISTPEKYPYVGGTMFWARVDAFKPLLDLQLMPSDFHSEHGQVDGTLAHAVERYIGILAHLPGRKFYSLGTDGTIVDITSKEYSEKYKYAP